MLANDGVSLSAGKSPYKLKHARTAPTRDELNEFTLSSKSTGGFSHFYDSHQDDHFSTTNNNTTSIDNDYRRPSKRTVLSESLAHEVDDEDDDADDDNSRSSSTRKGMLSRTLNNHSSTSKEDQSFFDLLNTFASFNLPKDTGGSSSGMDELESCPVCSQGFSLDDFATHVYGCIKQLDDIEKKELEKLDEKLARRLAEEDEENVLRGTEGDIDIPSAKELTTSDSENSEVYNTGERGGTLNADADDEFELMTADTNKITSTSTRQESYEGRIALIIVYKKRQTVLQ